MNKAEKKTVSKMIYIYCAAKHGTTHHLCTDCQSLHDYAMKRLDKCHYGEDKPTCQHCPIHCYAPAMKEKIRIVMRYSGPRMLYHSPLLAVKHMMKGLISKK